MIDPELTSFLFLYDVMTFLIVVFVSVIAFFAGSLWADREISTSNEEIKRLEFEHETEIKYLKSQNRIMSDILMNNSEEVEHIGGGLT